MIINTYNSPMVEELKESHKIEMSTFLAELKPFCDKLDAGTFSKYPPVMIEKIDNMDVPIYVIPSFSSIPALGETYKLAATHGVLIHLMSAMYNIAKEMKGRLAAKNIIRAITAHNGKLGFNWTKEGRYAPVKQDST